MKIFLIILYLSINVMLAPIVFAQDRNTVYIFKDEGVSQESLTQAISTFTNLFKKYYVKTINTKQIKDGVWAKNAILFVMPGGADLPYVKNLNGVGNNVIKQYVKDGGSFLGICAGSYYGSSYVEFDKNGPLEVLGKRELSFFKGSAIGPILAPYNYKTKSGCRAATIYTTLTKPRETTVFYDGGGFFENADQYPDTKVIATYANKLPAIILINYGKGKVLLSGVHFEYNPALLDIRDKYIQKIVEPLGKADDSRRDLLNNLMQLIEVR